MVYPYTVKNNGVWYKAGANVPDAKTVEVKANEMEEAETAPLPIFVTEAEKSYTKTEINRMSTAELQDLAEKEGIENARETSGGKLKFVLIKHFGL